MRFLCEELLELTKQGKVGEKDSKAESLLDNLLPILCVWMPAKMSWSFTTPSFSALASELSSESEYENMDEAGKAKESAVQQVGRADTC